MNWKMIYDFQFWKDKKAGKKWAEEQRQVELLEMPEITDPEVVALRQYVKGKWTMGESHGLPHWDNVYKNGILLQDEGVNERVVQRFAYLHDFCKQDDVKDRKHGPRVAEWMVNIRDSLLKSLSDEEFHLLQEACRLHTSTENTGNPTIDACFDADRLDLGRVGITPSPNKMATVKGRLLAQKILKYK